MQLAESIKRVRFIWRWYFVYNVRLIWYSAHLPQGFESASASESIAASLDRRRREAQKVIFDIIERHSGLCGDCGRCCLEEVDRYTAFDNYIHSSLDAKLSGFGNRIYDPIWMLSSGIKRSLMRYVKDDDNKPPPCRYLSPEGCTIDKEMRPMLCASWFCPNYIRKFSSDDMDKLEAPLREIESIHREIFFCLKRDD